MKKELSFQKSLVKHLKDFGVRAFHFSPAGYPGFFDLVIFPHTASVRDVSVYDTIFLELKDFTGESDAKTLKDILTKAQRPFYYGWLSQEGQTFDFVIKNEDRYGIITIFDVESLENVLKMTKLDLKYFFKKQSVREVAISILGFCFETGKSDARE